MRLRTQHWILLTLPAILPAQGTPPKPVAAAPTALSVAQELAAGRFAGYTFTGKRAAPKTIDEFGFVRAVLVEFTNRSNKKLDPKTLAALDQAMAAANRSKKEVRTAFDAAAKIEKGRVTAIGKLPEWTNSLQKAVVDAGIGQAVEPAQARPGDLVQWWFRFRSGNWGYHVGIVEKIEKGRAVIYGAHRSTLQAEAKLPAKKRKGGIGSGPVVGLDQTDKKVYVVRLRS